MASVEIPAWALPTWADYLTPMDIMWVERHMRLAGASLIDEISHYALQRMPFEKYARLRMALLRGDVALQPLLKEERMV